MFFSYILHYLFESVKISATDKRNNTYNALVNDGFYYAY